MGKTIITHLIDGNPQGSQYATINNRTCKIFLIPRSHLSIMNERDELQSPAFYILLGKNEDLKLKAYLGETENFKERVKSHDYKKTFWQKAFIFISNDRAMTKADVQYLEHLAISLATQAQQYVIDENRQIPKEPNLPEYQKDTMNDFFEDIKFLTSFMGCSIFDMVEQEKKHLFYTQARGCNAKGFYDENGFTVLKGSLVSKNTVPSFGAKERRNKFIAEYTSLQGDNLIVHTDYTFSSPSTAADFCVGNSNNGWLAWKDKKGQTLDDKYRKVLK